MAETFMRARWLLVGLLGLGLWLTPGASYGQSRELPFAIASQYLDESHDMFLAIASIDGSSEEARNKIRELDANTRVLGLCTNAL